MDRALSHAPGAAGLAQELDVDTDQPSCAASPAMRQALEEGQGGDSQEGFLEEGTLA